MITELPFQDLYQVQLLNSALVLGCECGEAFESVRFEWLEHACREKVDVLVVLGRRHPLQQHL